MTERNIFDAMGQADAEFLSETFGAAETAPPAEKPVNAKPEHTMNPVWRWVLTAGCAAACIGSAVMLVHMIPKDDYTYTQQSADNIEVTQDVLHTETTAAVRSAGTDAKPEQTETEPPKKSAETVTEPAAEQNAATTSAGEQQQTDPARTTAPKQQAAEVPVSRTEPAKTEPVTQQTENMPEELPETMTQTETENRHPTAAALFEKYSSYYSVEYGQLGWNIRFLIDDATDFIGDARRAGLVPEDAYSHEYAMINAYRVMHKSPVDPATGKETLTYSFIRCEYENGFYYVLRGDGNACIVGCDPYALMKLNPKKMVIPDKVGGAAVTEIGLNAFYNMCDSRGQWDALCEVVIPDTVEIVRSRAFQSIFGGRMDCKINLPANLREIHACAFEGLKNAFGEVIELPETVEYMRDNAFDRTVGKSSYPVPEEEVEAGLWDGKSAPSVEVRIKMPESLVFTDYAVPHRTQSVDQEQLEIGGYQKQFAKYYLNGECNTVCLNDALRYYLAKTDTENKNLASDTIWEMLRDD